MTRRQGCEARGPTPKALSLELDFVFYYHIVVALVIEEKEVEKNSLFR